MANIPKKTVSRHVRHSWTISNDYGPITARDLRDGMFFAEKDMTSLGIDVESDNGYHVFVSDDKLTLYVDIDLEE